MHGSWQNHPMAPTATSPSTDLQARLRIESMLADLSSRFVNLKPSEVDREMWRHFGDNSVLKSPLSAGGERGVRNPLRSG